MAWSINPHMRIGAVEFQRAVRQHGAFKDALARAGAERCRAPFVHGAFDGVFSKDSALLLDRAGVEACHLVRFHHPERQLEPSWRAQAYRDYGFEVVELSRLPCMGKGATWLSSPGGAGMLLGYGSRSSRSAASWLERSAGMNVTALELRDPCLYHLDMALSLPPRRNGPRL